MSHLQQECRDVSLLKLNHSSSLQAQLAVENELKDRLVEAETKISHHHLQRVQDSK